MGAIINKKILSINFILCNEIELKNLKIKEDFKIEESKKNYLRVYVNPEGALPDYKKLEFQLLECIKRFVHS